MSYLVCKLLNRVLALQTTTNFPMKSFLRCFCDIWPGRITFKHKDQVVNAANWTEILRLAIRSSSPVQLDATISGRTSAVRDAFHVRNHRAQKSLRPESVADDKLNHTPEFLHMFTLLPFNAELQNPASEREHLNMQLEMANNFLARNTNSSFRTAYKACKTSTRHALYTRIAELVEQGVGDNGQRRLDNQIALFNDADDLFQLFFPASLERPTTDKYWGAVESVIHVSQHHTSLYA